MAERPPRNAPFLVIGLGRFGSATAEQLVKQGREVLAIERDPDLVQKASGWMLREVGKRVDRAVLLDFLEAHAGAMGRTALSYATEHLDAELRAHLRSL